MKKEKEKHEKLRKELEAQRLRLVLNSGKVNGYYSGIQGCHCQGKKSGKRSFFQVGESQGILI